MLQLGCSSWNKVSVIAGRTRCSFLWQPGVNHRAGAFENGFQKAEGGRRTSKSAATQPENLEVSVHCHHRLLDKENRSSSGMLIQLVLNHLTLKSSNARVALSNHSCSTNNSKSSRLFQPQRSPPFHRMVESSRVENTSNIKSNH